MNQYTMEDYAIIRQHGYLIDVRGPYPVLFHGLRAWTFPSWDSAVHFAMELIGEFVVVRIVGL